LSPCGDIMTTPAPAPWTLFDPSKYIVHTLDRSGGPVLCNSSHSAVKSDRTCDFIAFHFSYVMSRGDNSVPHKETRPIAKGLFNMLDSGVLTTCVSFHVITWLLSFYCQDYVSYAHVLSTLIPALNALHRWSRSWWCMSPQKLFFCYHLPTRGWARVKLRDAWYVSNVSIIFDAPCLFYTICFMFCLHFVAFLCDFRN
jgi:hypothetical protein